MIERKEVMSGEDGSGLENTIREQCREGWIILKVEWEFHDDPQLDVGRRWKAFFARHEIP